MVRGAARTLAGVGARHQRPRARGHRPRITAGLVAILGMSAACDGTQSALAPAGPAAAEITGLWWVLCWTAGATYAAVLAALGAVVLRSRPAGRRSARAGDGPALRVVVFGGIVVPTLVGGALTIVTFRSLAALGPGPAGDELRVDVVGHQWWWEIRYPGGDPDRSSPPTSCTSPAGRPGPPPPRTPGTSSTASGCRPSTGRWT